MDSLDNNKELNYIFLEEKWYCQIYLPTETQQQIRAHGVEHRQKRLQEIADGHITSLFNGKSTKKSATRACARIAELFVSQMDAAAQFISRLSPQLYCEYAFLRSL
jgi:hypothetical protein